MRGSRGESGNRLGINRGLIAAALALLAAAPAARAQIETCAGSDAITLDCDGNNKDDVCDITVYGEPDTNGNGIPDACDFEVCFSNLCGGFDSATVGTLINGTDCNDDGIEWSNPSGSWTFGSGGCPPAVFPDPPGQSVKGVAQPPPISGEFLQSEYFHTDEEGRLECTSARYKFTADFRSEAALNPRIDWQIMLKDGSTGVPGTDPNVILIHLPSTQSAFPGVSPNRGRMLVKNPDAAGFLNLSPVFPIPANTCYRVEVELDNTAPAASAVKLYVNGTLRLTTKRLSPDAARIDYIYITQVANGQAAGGTNRLALDNISVCEEGPALDWDDCNSDCVDDLTNVALPGGSDEHSPDCNASLVPDECDNENNCSCDAPTVSHQCIWCNHKHDWDFESTDPDAGTEEIFALGPISGQRGWITMSHNSPDGTDATVSATNPNGQLSGRTLKLGPVGFGVTAESAVSPRTRNPAAADAPVEYWEVDFVLDTFDADQDMYFVIWDRCTDFTGQQFNDGPAATALNGVPFTAGVRIVCDPMGTNREVWLMDGAAAGLWRDQGANRAWSTNLKKHILIQLKNETNPPGVSYWANQHTHGFRETLSMFDIAIQNPDAGGSAHTAVITSSTVVNSYWDNFRYDSDTDCDCDGLPDSIWMPGTPNGQFFRACYDLNNNLLPDWCEDCNHNSMLDSVEIAGNPSLDCNLNGLPDTCDIDLTQPSCGHSGTVSPGGCIPGDDPQFWQVYSYRGGGSFDLGGPGGCAPDGIPDECQDDCNNNGLHDICDIASGTSLDLGGTGGNGCSPSGVPDECEADCNANRIHDRCDIASGTSLDCNTNQRPDSCDIAGGTSPDCNFNTKPDSCDIAAGTSQDCDPNGPALPNGIPDICDITGGTSQDANGDGTPDECAGVPAATVTSLISRVAQAAGPGGNCDATDADGSAPFKVTEAHSGGASEVRIGFNVAPAAPVTSGVTVQQATCAAPAYVAYSGAAFASSSVTGTELVVAFSPGLETGRTYRLNIGADVTSVAGQSVEVRVLSGDATVNGLVDAADRSAIVGVWTGVHFSCLTDITNSGLTDAGDRSAVVGAWTNPSANCAP